VRAFATERLRFNGAAAAALDGATAAAATAHGALAQGSGSGDVHQQSFVAAHPSSCNSTNWAVVTTIFEPSEAIRKVTRFEGWCLVVVADEKTRDAPYLDVARDAPGRVVYLSVERQRIMASARSGAGAAVREFAAAMPWNHFSRKNLGYLFAIGHGARLVFDFDDDNELKALASVPCENDARECASIRASLPPAGRSSLAEEQCASTQLYSIRTPHGRVHHAVLAARVSPGAD
jgi:hypothetical protein